MIDFNKICSRETLASWTIELDGNTVQIPTFPITAKEQEELLELNDGEQIIIDGTLIKRVNMRWFVYDGQHRFSLRHIHQLTF